MKKFKNPLLVAHEGKLPVVRHSGAYVDGGVANGLSTYPSVGIDPSLFDGACPIK